MVQQEAFSMFSLMLFSLLSVSTADSNIYVKCSQLYFTPATPYESNLNSLFTSLIDSSSVSNFNKFEISSTTPGDSDVAYGLFQCRGDLNSSNCIDCVTNSVSQLKTACPVSTGGTIQLDGCFVKYDNTFFFGAENKMEVSKKCGPSIGNQNSYLKKRRHHAMSYLTSGNRQYFREGNFGTIKGVAQCIEDLSLKDCQDCLSEAGARLTSECGTSSWGSMFLGTCYIQYADNGDGSDMSASDNSGGGSNNGVSQWLGNIFSVVVSSVLGGAVSYGVTVKNTKNYITINELNIKIKQVKKETKEQIEETKEKADAATRKVDELNMRATLYTPSPYPCPCGQNYCCGRNYC